MRATHIAVAISLAVLASSPTSAAQIYNDSASFSGAAGQLSLYDLDQKQEFNSFNIIPLVYQGLSFSVDRPGYNANGNLISDSSDGNEFYSVNGTPFAAIDLVSGATFRLTFGRSVNAFGASFVGLANAGRTEVVSLLGSTGQVLSTFTITGPPNVGDNRDFYGFVSDVPFAAISLTHTSQSINDFIGMDNLLVGTFATVVPEPAIWAMMMIGFGMIGAAARYRRRSTQVRYV